MKKILSLLVSGLLYSSGLYAQTLVPEVENISVSPDNFYTGIRRSVSSDVQKSTGKIVTVYTDKDASAATGDVWCVIYNPDMSIAVNAFRINYNTANMQYYPKVKVNQMNNYFVVTWTSNHNGTDYDAYAKKVSLDVTDATSAAVASASDYVINSGTIVTGNQYLPIAAFNYSDNKIVFVFRDDSGKDNGVTGSQGVYGQIFNGSNFTPIGSNFLINSTTTNNQIPESAEISPLNSDLIVSYASNNNPTNDYDVIVRRATYSSFTSSYTFSSEFIVNNYTAGPQQWSYINFNSNGDYVVSWSSQQDGSGYGVYAKIFNASHTLIKDEFIVNGSTADNQLISKCFWEEATKKLVFFYHYSVSNFSTLKYMMFDYSGTNLYLPMGTEQNALLNAQNTNSYYSMPHDPTYNPYNNRVYITYDIFNNFTGDSKSKARAFIYKHPNLVTPSFVNSTDLTMNWIHSREYGEDGSLKAEVRQYYDSLGNITQSQMRNVVANKILAANTIYDQYNKPVLSTLPAPIPDANFQYRADFMYVTSYPYTRKYSYLDFDSQYWGSASDPGHVDNPVAVSTSSLLGKYYYSNADEQYVPNTTFPYSRIDYNVTVPGGVQRSSAPGYTHKMGSGHEKKAVELPVANELDHYITLKKNFFQGNTQSYNYNSLAQKAKKVVSIDESGLESIAFKDFNGIVIATAKAAGATPESQTATLSPTMYYFNLPVPPYPTGPGTASNIKITDADEIIEIYDIVNNVSLYSGYANDLNAIMYNQAVSITGQIRSKAPFKVTYDIVTATGTNTYARLNALNNVGVTIFDLYLKDPSSLSLTPLNTNSGSTTSFTIKVLNLQTGVVLYTGSPSSFSNTSIPSAGFYRIQLEDIPFNNDYSQTSVKLQINYTFPYSDWSYYFYDLRGNLQGTLAPNGIDRAVTTAPSYKTTYTYNTLGSLLSVTDPNKGLTEFVYRKDGTLRFSQNAKQHVTGKFSYTNFDRFCRPVESGEYDPSLVTTNAKVFVNHLNQETLTANPNSVHTIVENVSIGGGLESAGRTQANYMAYDVAASDVPRTPAYLKTKVSYSYKKDKDTDATYTSKTWYSYDERGRLVWMDQSLTGLGTKTIDYTYTKELLTNVTYQSGTVAEKFQHKYTYDKAQRLVKAESAAGNGLFQTEGQYYYYLHGPLKRTELGNNVQGVDYIYTLLGALKSINHPELTSAKDPGHDGASGSAFSKDVFGMSIDYFDNDYVNTSSNINNVTGTGISGYAQNYNGLIRNISWQTQGQSLSGNAAVYAYTYDYKGQLLNADFGSRNVTNSNFTLDATNRYRTQASYDTNGNLLFLQNDKGASTGDGYGYNYVPLGSTSPATADKLVYLINYRDNNDSRGYTYDEIGQMTQESRNSGLVKNLVYDAYGKVIEVKSGSITKVKFVYNERGQRVKKVTYTSAGVISFTTWYIMDASGNVMSIHDDRAVTNTFAQTEIPIYGSGRIGVVQKNNSTLVYTYELKDHLGNIRATVDRVKQGNGDASLITWMDYLPFGEVNPDRHNYGTYTRRRECQGEDAEYDSETEWNAFDYRMYDARIGRWLSTDPADQNWSPYLAMGNNPVSLVDPDGREQGLPSSGPTSPGTPGGSGNGVGTGGSNSQGGITLNYGALNGGGNSGLNATQLSIVAQVIENNQNTGKTFSFSYSNSQNSNGNSNLTASLNNSSGVNNPAGGGPIDINNSSGDEIAKTLMRAMSQAAKENNGRFTWGTYFKGSDSDTEGEWNVWSITIKIQNMTPNTVIDIKGSYAIGREENGSKSYGILFPAAGNASIQLMDNTSYNGAGDDPVNSFFQRNFSYYMNAAFKSGNNPFTIRWTR